MKVRKHVSYEPDRHGNDRWYYRRGNYRCRLAGRPGDELFEASFAEANTAFEQKTGVKRVYFLRAGRRIKIGTTANVESRLAALRTSIPTKSFLTHITAGGHAKEAELHRLFSEDRLKGEWFRHSDQIKAWIAADKERNKHGRCLTFQAVLSHQPKKEANSNG